MQAWNLDTDQGGAASDRPVLRQLEGGERPPRAEAPDLAWPATDWADDGEGPVRGRLRKALLALD
jgi:hypothetical protein